MPGVSVDIFSYFSASETVYDLYSRVVTNRAQPVAMTMSKEYFFTVFAFLIFFELNR